MHCYVQGERVIGGELLNIYKNTTQRFDFLKKKKVISMIYRRKNVRICILFLQINLFFSLGFSYLAVSTYWYGGATIPNIRNGVALTLLLLPGCSVAINKKKYIPAPRGVFTGYWTARRGCLSPFHLNGKEARGLWLCRTWEMFLQLMTHNVGDTEQVQISQLAWP